ncbi:NAD(P)/FAD-dependent oxidoreductase [Aspergillus undulatus]|uniref:NAD(P)/FAD-dependent oxidoreductase n=1 Tax=Aspergillus undulatus TaxID=1810928 RepID=UPI003CCCCB30
MLSDKLTLLLKALPFVLNYLLNSTLHRLTAISHKWTYAPTPNAKTILVIGGSFAGLQTVRRLCQTIPTGYKVLWIEKNSHLNYVFALPRFSVIKGLESKAFIPYSGIEKSAPRGMLRRVHGTVQSVDGEKKVVKLNDGTEVEYEYLVLATGSTRPVPSQLLSSNRDDAIGELRDMQHLVKGSQKIAIVGAGAVGVELAADIKDVYPGKEVTLVHSHEGILSRFGERLGMYALQALRDELRVRVLLRERPEAPKEKGGLGLMRDTKLVFGDGREEEFDLVIPCTGQTPNSSILSSSHPEAISENGQVLVEPTLQLQVATSTFTSPSSVLKQSPQIKTKNEIFALGDVAAHTGPLMARAGFMQAEIVVRNILSLINGREPRAIYRPNWFIEGSIKITLGQEHYVVYACERDGKGEVLIASRGGKVDLDVGRAWGELGVSMEAAGATI